jgi:flavodoxin
MNKKKAIVVYFSLEGNSKYVADIIVKYLEADTLRLITEKDYPKGNVSKYFWGGKSVVFGEKPKLVSYSFNADEYNLIIIGTPVWAGSFAPPIKTFLGENDLKNKKIALYACNSGGDADKCFNKLKKEIPDCEVIATLALADPKVKQLEENSKMIKEFCNRISQIKD